MVIATDGLVAAVNGHSLNGNGDASRQKPYLVFCATPASGHTFPLIQIAGEMIKRGFEASFVGGEEFDAQFDRVGISEKALVPDHIKDVNWEERMALPIGLPRLLFDMKKVFIDPIPQKFGILKQTLEGVRRRMPGREVVIVHEAAYLGAVPFARGAPPPEGYDVVPRIVNVQVIPYVANSVDTATFGPGLPPDNTPSGKARNALINQLMDGVFGELTAYTMSLYKSLGATDLDPRGPPFSDMTTAYKTTLQMCPPSMEYPRSDLHPGVRFAGALPPKTLPPSFEYPSWWSDLDGKKVIVVTQGTVATVYSDLLQPAITALGSRDDAIVVAILAVKGAKLPDDFEIPANCRVIDYLAYDAILPRADVFVQNAGYGGAMHAVVHAVPLVVAGQTEDKAEVSMRIEWAGVGVNLHTNSATPEQIRGGVEEVLSNPSYKKRMLEIQAENAKIDTFGIVEEEILRPEPKSV